MFGYEPTSLVEWPGKIVSIIFLDKCNFRCPFCHNSSLVLESDKLESINFFEVLEDIASKKEWVDAVEITGGEPTLHPELKQILQQIKKQGFLTKLDTNGTFPDKIKELLDKKLIDYIAMDVKNCFEKYSETSGTEVDIEKIKKSIEIIKKSAPDYEFRTTVLPKHHTKEDIKKISQHLKGAKKYIIQNFRPLNTLNPDYMNEKSFSEAQLKALKETAEKYIEKVEYR